MRDIPQATSLEFSKLIGVSYEELDCWKLVQKFYSSVLGTELFKFYEGPVPSYSDRDPLIKSSKGYFTEVFSPTFGDILVFRIRGFEAHLGVFYKGDKFLHTTEKTGSILDSLEKWKPTLAGIYRLND